MRRRVLTLVSVAVTLAIVAGAIAYFVSTGTSTASAGVGAINAPANTTTRQAGTDMTISWNAATLSNGNAVQGYRVTRSDSSVVCGSPTLVTGLSCTDTNVAGGTYTYTVTAVLNGFSGSATTASVTVLSTPTIDQSPANPSASSALSFAFSGGGGTGYACQLDGGTFTTCSSPKAYSGLTNGAHTFKVHATRGGSSGPDVTYTWTIDTIAPVTSITLSPSSPSGSNGWYATAPSFTLTASDSGGSGIASTSYSIDAGGTHAYSGAVTVPEGQHTVSYWSTDQAGNSETHHTTSTIKVDTTAATNSPSLAGALIWANFNGFAIGRANRDGTNATPSFFGAGHPQAVAADGSHLYWTNYDQNTIGRSGHDGTTGFDASFITGVANVLGLAVDSSYIYWSNGGSIARAKLDGTGTNQSFVPGGSGTWGVAVDASHIYWTNNTTNAIGRANLDGSSPDQSFITGASAPRGIAVDGSYIYWSNGGNGTVSRAKLDGTGAQVIVGGIGRAYGVAVDANYLYSTDQGGLGRIGRSNLDGSASNPTFITTATASSPFQPAVVPASADAVLSGGTLYYRGGTAGSFNIGDAVSDSGSGPASASFPAISTSGWTHAAQTVTTGSGSAPTVSYTSSAFSWSANPTNPTGYALTSTDAAGNAGPAPLTFVNDSTGPTGGALTVDGTVATSGGSTSATNVTSFPIDARSDYGESQTSSQSGLRSSVLTVQSETLSGNTCGAPGSGGPFPTPTAIAGTTQPSGIDLTHCYLYRLAGTDSVGNVSTVTTTVIPDTTAPTDSLSLSAPVNALLAGNTLYYNGGGPGSFAFKDGVGDAGSGPASASFPAIGTAGWTHGAETVSAGTGSAPTITYTSSVFSWTSNPGNPSGYSVTSKDSAGNTSSATTPIFVNDAIAPAGGALSVNGTVATSSNSVSTTTSSAFPINSRTDYSEAQTSSQSGLKTSVLTVQSETLGGTTCGGPSGPFATATTITGTAQPSGLDTTHCYLYTLTGSDNVGSVSTVSTTVIPLSTFSLVGDWTFSNASGGETTGNWAPLDLKGSASVAGGQLAVAGTGNGGNAATAWARAKTYTGPAISDKTMVSWVQLDSTAITTGAPVSLYKPAGDVFDAVDYAERQSFRWMSGSNNFVRTGDFSPGIDDTNAGAGSTREIAISYKNIGGGQQTITGCLNGVQLGQYTTGITSFAVSDNPVALFGPRHMAGGTDGTPTGSITAHIDESRIYNQAIPCSQVAQLHDSNALPLDASSGAKLEAEGFVNKATVVNGSLSTQSNCCGITWSGGTQLIFTGTPASTMTVPFSISAGGTYDLNGALTKSSNTGIYTLAVDGQQIGSSLDTYTGGAALSANIDQGHATLTAGSHTLTVAITGKNPSSSGYIAAVDYLRFTP